MTHDPGLCGDETWAFNSLFHHLEKGAQVGATNERELHFRINKCGITPVLIMPSGVAVKDSFTRGRAQRQLDCHNSDLRELEALGFDPLRL